MKFILKWLINGVIVVAPLMYYAENATFLSAAVTATVLTVIAYFAGDLFLLRATNNTVATVSDAILAFLVLWIASYLMNWRLNFAEMLFIAVLLGVAEWIIHRYLFSSKLTVQAG